MSEHSAISWTDATWNCLAGCTRVSAGCDFCYAAELAAGRLKNTPAYEGLAVKTPGGRAAFNGRVRYIPDKLCEPLRWRSPKRIFVNSMSDLFHDAVPEVVIDRVFAVMALAPRHTFQILTKRPERMQAYCAALTPERLVAQMDRDADGRIGPGFFDLWYWSRSSGWPMGLPLPNVWLGVSVENQCAADERIPLLLKTPAAVRFISAEPLLGPIELSPFGGLDWVIVGGESGPKHRPMDVEWAEAIAHRCALGGVPLFVKQDSGPRPGMRGRLSDALWALKQFPSRAEAAHA